jgi:sugar lactone lactonase YvrE
LQIDYQTAKKSKISPLETKIIKKEKTKTLHEQFNKQEKIIKPIPKRKVPQSWTEDSPKPEAKKIATARLKSKTVDKTRSIRKEKVLKKFTLNPTEYTSTVGERIFIKTVEDMKSPQSLPGKKTMQQTKPVQPPKTKEIVKILKSEILEKQTKFVPATKRLPLTEGKTPSIHPGKEKIPSRSHPTILAEKSQLQKSAPATQTPQKKSSALLPTTTPDKTKEFKIAMQIEHQAYKKNVNLSTDTKQIQTLKTRTLHETFEEKVKQIQQGRVANIKIPIPKRQKNTTLVSETKTVPAISSQPVRSTPIARKNPVGLLTLAAEPENYIKTMPVVESPPTPSGRKTIQPAERVESTPSSRTKIKVEQFSSPRKEIKTPVKQTPSTPTIDRQSLPKKTTPILFPAQNKLQSPPITREEKHAQQRSTPTTQTAKRSPESRPISLTTEIESRHMVNIATYYQSPSTPRVIKSTPSPIPKQGVLVEDKKIDKQISIQRESHGKLAALTPGDVQKTNIYDLLSTSIKKKKLDKIIYDSFIIPQKRDKATLTSFLTNHFLNRNPVKEILVTSKGNIWAGIEGGILKYDGYKWDFLQSAGKLPGEVVYTLAEAADGTFWIGTNNGLVQLDKSGNRVVSSGQLSGEIFDIRVDREGTVWAGTDSGLFQHKGDHWEAIDIPQEIADTGVNTIVEDSQGRMWIGTEKGLSVYNGKKWVHFDTKDGLVHNNVQSLAVDAKGNLWCGTEDGVSRYNGKNFQSYTKTDGLADNMVYTVKTDEKGNIWFGTGAGVSKFNNYKFYNYDRKNGLLGWNVHSIAIAEGGEYWFGTDRGVSKMMEAN